MKRLSRELRPIIFPVPALAAVVAVAYLFTVAHESVTAQTVDSTGELTLSEVVRRVLESDPGIIVSRNRALQAREQHNLTRAGIRPRVELDVRPYSFDQRRVPVPPAAPIETRTHSFGGGISLQQPLTTSGAVSAGIDHSVRRVSPEGDPDRWEQVPEIRLGVTQPLFGGNQFMGSRLYRAGLRESEIGTVQADVLHDAARNDAVREVLELYIQTGNLRSAVDLLEETIELLRTQLESAELDRQQGLISDTALLALQVTLNNRREALFSTQLQLAQVEQWLARSIGIDTVHGMDLEPVPGSVEVPRIDDLDRAIANNPRVRAGELTVEQAEQRALLGTARDRPSVSAFARALPVYPAQRDNPDDFSSSFSDLLDDDAGLEISAGISLTIPLLTERQREYRTRIDELTRRNALVELEDTEQVLVNRMRILTTNRRFLEERLELLDIDIEYEERRVQNERTLLDAGVATALRVREVELDLRSRLNERRRVQAELLLNSLDILNLLGEDLTAVFAP